MVVDTDPQRSDAANSVIDANLYGKSNVERVCRTEPTVNHINNTNAEKTMSTDQSLFNNKYNLKLSHIYHAPYYVYVEHSEKNVGKLHPMALGKFLHIDLNIKNDIIEISRMGINRVKIEMKSVNAINKLIENPMIKDKGYIAYVPRHLTERKGVIKGVCTSLEDNLLKSYIDSNVRIKHCKRAYRKVSNSENIQQIPTQTIFITFEGSVLPRYVFLNSVRCLVEPFVSNVIQCTKCLRFRHVASQCRSKDKLCVNCGSVHEGECSDEDRLCRHCNSPDHNSLNKNCPRYKKEKQVKYIMATSNVSYAEAEKKYNDPNYSTVVTTKNRFELLDSGEEFPPLNFSQATQVSTKKDYPNHITVNKITKKRKIQTPSPTLEREFDVFNLPEKPLSANPFKPELITERIIDVVFECFHKFFVSFNKDLKLGEEQKAILKNNIKSSLNNSLSDAES